MALRAGCRGPSLDEQTARTLLDASRWKVESSAAGDDDEVCSPETLCTLNGYLRTGADKGNPTV